MELRVFPTKTPYRENRKAYVFAEEVRAMKLLKAARMKIGWVSCSVRRKKELNRCFRCLGFGHIVAECRGPDCSSCCWRCGVKGHNVGSCTRKPCKERRSHRSIISWGQCVARLFGSQSPEEAVKSCQKRAELDEAVPKKEEKKRGDEADSAWRWLPLWTNTSRRFRGGISWPRNRMGVLVGRVQEAAEFQTPGEHEAYLKVHKALLFSSKKKKNYYHPYPCHVYTITNINFIRIM